MMSLKIPNKLQHWKTNSLALVVFHCAWRYTSKMKNRFYMALLISPLAPVVPFSFMPLVNNSIQFNLIIFFFALATSYLGTIIIGLPTVKILKHFNILNLPSLVLLGTISGILVFYLCGFLLDLFLDSKSGFHISTVIWGAAFGFIVSLTFGLISGITSHLKGNA